MGIVSKPATAVLADLRGQGLEFSQQRGNIKVKGPARALTAENYQKVTYYEKDLLELLASEEEEEAAADAGPLVRGLGAAVLSADTRTEAAFSYNVRVQLRAATPGRWT